MRRALANVAGIMACASPPLPAGDASPPGALRDAVVIADRADTPALQRVPIGGACALDAVCDDGAFCNGVERCERERCVAGSDPCDDGARCTADRCDEEGRRCLHTADNPACADGDLCNGVERCDPSDPSAERATGCTRPALGVDCNDDDPCTIDSCAPTQGCVHAPRDLDDDGHVDRACPRDGRVGSALGDDCDDRDPAVHPQVTERCGDARDNNCDGLIDLADAVACRPANSACAAAVTLHRAGSEAVSYGSTSTFASGAALPCVDATITRGTAWYQLTLDAPSDLTVRVESGARSGEAPGAVAIVSACGASLAARCASGSLAGDAGAGSDPELRAHGLGAGVWYIAVQTAGARPFSVRARLSPVTDGGT